VNEQEVLFLFPDHGTPDNELLEFLFTEHLDFPRKPFFEIDDLGNS
jgi:hypothetical protein